MRKILGLWLSLCAAAYPAVEPEFHVPFEKYKLPNGLRVILSRDNSVPLAAVCLVYLTGSRDEEKAAAGFANLFEHMMAGGSANVKRGEQLKYVQANGGRMDGAAHVDYTDFYDVMPSNQLALALWLEADRMRSPNLTEENLTSAKEAVRAEQKMLYAQPYRSALADQWPSLLFSDFHDAPPTPGTSDDLAAATLDEISKPFHTKYAPNNAVLVIAGDFAAAEARKMVGQYFADIPSQPQPPSRPGMKEPVPITGKTLTVTDEHARYPAVVLGWPAPRRHSPDWYALNMLDAVLTSGRGSRLEREVMNGRQSVLQVEANLGWPWSSPLDFRDPGHYVAMLIHKPNFTAPEVVGQYQQVIDAIAESGVDATELKRVKAVLRLAEANGLQTALDRARLLGVFEALDGDAGLIERDPASLLAVTSSQLQAAAKQYMTAARRSVLVINAASTPGVKR